MGLNRVRREPAGFARAFGRSSSYGKELMLAGVAVIALTSAAAAQQASGQTPSEAQEAQTAETKPAGNATLLDKILLLSRTGETAIESLSSSSHVDQEQIGRAHV